VKSGERLRTQDGQLLDLTASRPRAAAAVFHLEVNTEHVYYVGIHGLLVHNSCDGKGVAPRVGNSSPVFGSLKDFSRKWINKVRNSASALEGKNFTRGQRALQKKVGRPGDKFAEPFGLQPGHTPTQADVNRIIEAIMDSPTASIKKQKISSLFKRGGYKVFMDGRNSPGIALDPDGSFLDFLN